MHEYSESDKRLSLVIPSELGGERLDSVLAGLLADQSRAFLKKLLDRGGVTVNGRVAKPSLKVKGGEAIEAVIPAPTRLEVEAEDLPLDVLYEDDDIVVINKRPGMVAHPSQGHHAGTVVNALLHHYGDSLSGIGGVLRPGIVHRLDRDTSGCLVAAKNDAAHRALIQQFMNRDVEKTYLAITDGVPRPVCGTVEGNIGRSRSDRKRHAMLTTGGRHSLTHYRTMENYGSIALVECRLMTGRTHQARVHLAHAGAPVLCDGDYGKRQTYTDGDAAQGVELLRSGGKPQSRSLPGKVLLGRQALHAWKLGFTHPVKGNLLAFEAPLPADMEAVLAPFRRLREEMA